MKSVLALGIGNKKRKENTHKLCTRTHEHSISDRRTLVNNVNMH